MAEQDRKKRQKVAAAAEDSGDGSGGSPWEGMTPEVLALILVHLPADEMLRTVPFVCRSWREVVAGPYCWEVIDVEQWCRRVNRSDVIDSAVRKLVRRSRGNLRRLSAYKLGNSAFSVAAANSGGGLKVLQIPMSDITDQMVEKHAVYLTKLEMLDISYCLSITSKGIETLGSCCKSLVHFRRNMPPPEMEFGVEMGAASKADDGEALAVASTMPGLQHLELAYGRFSDRGLNVILTKCEALHVLDIRGCWSVKMDADLEDQCVLIKDFRGPWDDDYDDASCSGEDGENSGKYAVLVDVDSSDESDSD